MLRFSLKKNVTVRNCYPKATKIETTNTTHCVCSKCHKRVPYVSRRCIAQEDENGNVKLFGKLFNLTNLCLDCLRES